MDSGSKGRKFESSQAGHPQLTHARFQAPCGIFADRVRFLTTRKGVNAPREPAVSSSERRKFSPSNEFYDANIKLRILFCPMFEHSL